MAKRKRKNKKSLLLSFVVIILLLLGIGVEKDGGIDTNPYSASDAYVHFIDVGQGSSTLIQIGDKGILIDAGEKEYGDYVVEYIDSCGIKELEYVIASHPHSDHIGGMTDVIEECKIGEFIMPELTEINIPTTKVYERMISALLERDVDVTAAKVGDSFITEGITMKILGPYEQTEDLNDMSVICKATVNGVDFMILGDAEKGELSSVYNNVNAGYESDVIAMGHHGSSTSIYKSFLNAVNADTAVISCGKDNSYGHPHKEALQYIKNNGMTLYRTDYDGDVVFRCAGGEYERVDY
ncbi:MAG: MBL fold metallo-hydrolase [Acutalibacteraceae bacterium]|nr:MBL fold metallo-hydrolase [Acutalibacteraceae bacterium]